MPNLARSLLDAKGLFEAFALCVHQALQVSSITSSGKRSILLCPPVAVVTFSMTLAFVFSLPTHTSGIHSGDVSQVSKLKLSLLLQLASDELLRSYTSMFLIIASVTRKYHCLC